MPPCPEGGLLTAHVAVQYPLYSAHVAPLEAVHLNVGLVVWARLWIRYPVGAALRFEGAAILPVLQLSEEAQLAKVPVAQDNEHS